MYTVGSTSKADRTRALRYKRPALKSLGYDFLSDELYEIATACSDVRYFIESDTETLLNALDGDDDAAFEFQMAFSDLDRKAEQLGDAIRDRDVREYFDDCTVGLIGNRYTTVGYDSIEEDYFGLTRFEQELAYTESGQRLMRRTKQEIISIVGQCLGIVVAFLDLRQSYDYLKATFDILRDENTALLTVIKEIEAAYEVAAKEGFDTYAKATAMFDARVANLPDRTWIE